MVPSGSSRTGFSSHSSGGCKSEIGVWVRLAPGEDLFFASGRLPSYCVLALQGESSVLSSSSYKTLVSSVGPALMAASPSNCLPGPTSRCRHIRGEGGSMPGGNTTIRFTTGADLTFWNCPSGCCVRMEWACVGGVRAR